MKIHISDNDGNLVSSFNIVELFQDLKCIFTLNPHEELGKLIMEEVESIKNRNDIQKLYSLLNKELE